MCSLISVNNMRTNLRSVYQLLGIISLFLASCGSQIESQGQPSVESIKIIARLTSPEQCGYQVVELQPGRVANIVVMMPDGSEIEATIGGGTLSVEGVKPVDLFFEDSLMVGKTAYGPQNKFCPSVKLVSINRDKFFCDRPPSNFTDGQYCYRK